MRTELAELFFVPALQAPAAPVAGKAVVLVRAFGLS